MNSASTLSARILSGRGYSANKPAADTASLSKGHILKIQIISFKLIKTATSHYPVLDSLVQVFNLIVTLLKIKLGVTVHSSPNTA
jgi:hypothetical protein